MTNPEIKEHIRSLEGHIQFLNDSEYSDSAVAQQVISNLSQIKGILEVQLA